MKTKYIMSEEEIARKKEQRNAKAREVRKTLTEERKAQMAIVSNKWYAANKVEANRISKISYRENRKKISEAQKVRRAEAKKELALSKQKYALTLPPLKPVPYDNAKAYAFKDIAKLIGVTSTQLIRVRDTLTYKMPPHMYIRLDGTVIYEKKVIDEWVPYVKELLAFYNIDARGKKRKKGFTITGNALMTILLRRKNKKVTAHCDKERRGIGKVYG